MSEVDKIKSEIEALPDHDYVELRRWFSERDWEKWDRQIEEDSESGKLDFLIEEVLNEKASGKLGSSGASHNSAFLVKGKE